MAGVSLRRARRLFHVPCSDEPGGEPANHSAGSATGSHQSRWRTACSGHGYGRSRFCCLRRRSRQPRRCLECERPESVPYFCCQCLHNRSGSFFRRQLVCLPVKEHDRNTCRRSFPHAVPTPAELQQIPGRTLVPGIALHPSGALIYQPFLTGAPGSAGVKGGIDILDAHSGALRLRIFLPL
jgi:hypothetical protein